MYDNDHIVWVSCHPNVLPPFRCLARARRFMSNIQHISIKDGGRLLAEAVVQSHPDLVDAQLRVEAGHIRPGARSELVDAVLDLPDVSGGTRLEITLPTGDAEMLEQIRNRCHTINTRVAGVSCRLHTTFPAPNGLPS